MPSGNSCINEVLFLLLKLQIDMTSTAHHVSLYRHLFLLFAEMAEKRRNK